MLLEDNERKHELRTSIVCTNMGLTRGLWWFLLFYVLVFNFFVLLAPYVCYHILAKLR